MGLMKEKEMNIVIGFGSTEQAFEEGERKAFEGYVAQRFNELGCDYITEELARDVEVWLDARAAEFKARGDEYKTAADYPERYTYYWVSLIRSASTLVAKFSFHHINRRHALSPDGWALMVNKRLFDVDATDLRRTVAA